MSLKKMFVNGIAALALTFAVTGCGIFDSSNENEEMFRIKKDKAGQTAVDSDALKGASGDVNTIGCAGDGNGPGDWSNNALSDALNPYADFGTPIPGVNLPTVYFSFDRSIISATEAPKLDEIAAYLLSNAGTGVVIEGNCDDRGSDEYNRALGERRARRQGEGGHKQIFLHILFLLCCSYKNKGYGRGHTPRAIAFVACVILGMTCVLYFLMNFSMRLPAFTR